jgi:hypothetical protein
MTKFLQALKTRLGNLKNGIHKNLAVWNNQPESEATLAVNITAIEDMEQKVKDAEEALMLARKEARELERELTLVADTVENKAIGFHTATPDRLINYDIHLRKERQKRPVPSELLVVDLKDDVDGEGFIITTQVDINADRYEWEKGMTDDPKNLDIIPKMSHFKTASKTSFVDDDVVAGTRYFYRVRAINCNGEGPWSNPSSRVQ